MFYGSPVKAPRKPLEDISNSANAARPQNEHFTPKKRKIDASTTQQKEDIPVIGSVPQTPSERRTPVKIAHPSSSARRVATPSVKTDQTKHPLESHERSHGTRREKSEELPSAKPFPNLEPDSSPSGVTSANSEQSPPPSTVKETIKRASIEMRTGKNSYFKELSIHLQYFRDKYHLTETLMSRRLPDELPAIVYTEIPLVKAKLDEWKEKYARK